MMMRFTLVDVTSTLRPGVTVDAERMTDWGGDVVGGEQWFALYGVAAVEPACPGEMALAPAATRLRRASLAHGMAGGLRQTAAAVGEGALVFARGEWSILAVEPVSAPAASAAPVADARDAWMSVLPDPPADLADAWRRFQAGERVEPHEGRALDEWRADCAADAGF